MRPRSVTDRSPARSVTCERCCTTASVATTRRCRLRRKRATTRRSCSRHGHGPAAGSREAKRRGKCRRNRARADRGGDSRRAHLGAGNPRQIAGARERGRGSRELVRRIGRALGPPVAPISHAHTSLRRMALREKRRADARAQLRAAHDQFTSIGMEAFAERARRELSATGETVPARIIEARDDLTQQEGQIARMASDGLSNPEIGARLFLVLAPWNTFRKVFRGASPAAAQDLPSCSREYRGELAPAPHGRLWRSGNLRRDPLVAHAPRRA
jgi:hypothetical protein